MCRCNIRKLNNQKTRVIHEMNRIWKVRQKVFFYLIHKLKKNEVGQPNLVSSIILDNLHISG